MALAVRMSMLEELVWAFVRQVLFGSLFMTGEILHWMATLGAHRIRWWESVDPNVIWPKAIIGLVFWGAVAWLLWSFVL